LPASWVEYPFFSDHAPIFLQLRSPDRHISTSFKFNHNWLTEDDYTELVSSVWRDPIFLSEDNAQHRLFWKLQVLKARSKSWFHEKSNLEKGPPSSTGGRDLSNYKTLVYFQSLNREGGST
jgi:hypothetical protein